MSEQHESAFGGPPPQAPSQENHAPESKAAPAPADLLKIGDFARLAKTNLRTLRYYEELGLLRPAVRSEGGFRYYRPTDVNRVDMIRNLQGLGLQLDRISELMAGPDRSASAEVRMAHFGEALIQQRAIIDEHIQTLETQRAAIDQASEKLKECARCGIQPCAENNFCDPCVGDNDPLPSILSALF